MVKPGKYIAKIVEYGVPDVEPGKHPCVTIGFEFDQDGSTQQITYWGYLSAASAEYTLKNLLTCGMVSDNPASLCKPNAFDGREVQIVIENEEHNGKDRAKVKWINPVGASRYKPIDPGVAQIKLGGFEAYVKGLRTETGMKSDFAPVKDDFTI